MASTRKLLGEARAGEELGPIHATVDRTAADRFLARSGYSSAFFGPDGAAQDIVPPGALGEVYTDMLDAKGYYFLNAVQARCEEQCFRPVAIAEPLTCVGSVTDAGTTRSGLVFVDIEARVIDSQGAAVFRSQNRLVVTPEEDA